MVVYGSLALTGVFISLVFSATGEFATEERK
jgi:hypothetical protein